MLQFQVLLEPIDVILPEIDDVFGVLAAREHPRDDQKEHFRQIVSLATIVSAVRNAQRNP